MIMDTQRRVRAARVAGDNLNVVRYCASDGRIRRPQIQELLDGAIGGLRGEGLGPKMDGGKKERE